MSGSLLATDPGTACVIVAAPGYGATTAVQQALRGSTDDVCWVSLDDTVSDADAQALMWAAVGADSGDPDSVLAAVTGSGSKWLVLDGLEPHAHAGLLCVLGAVMDRLPPSCRVLVTAHAALELPRARYHDERLLAFAVDDAFDLIAALVPEVDVDEAAEIIAVADGWVSALVAGAQRLTTQPGAGQWLREHGPSELLSGWFDRLPETRRQLLHMTSVLDLLCEGPVARITGDPAAQDRLAELAASHAYVWECQPMAPGTGQWWRRHPMLTTFLRQRAGTESTQLHNAAADWFVAAGDVPSAMTHLIASGRFRDAADMLTQHESALLSSGEAPQVLQWYGKLATAQFDRIEAAFRTAWGHALARDIAGADAGAARVRTELAALQGSEQDGSRERLDYWQSEEALLRAYLASFHGDPATIISGARHAMVNPHPDRSRDATQLAPLLLVRGLMWSGQTRAAVEAFDRIDQDSYRNEVLRNLHLAGERAMVLCESGRIRQAREVLAGIDRWAREHELSPVSIHLYSPDMARAWIALEGGDVAAAADIAHTVASAAEEHGLLCDATWAHIMLARCETARGDFGAAMRALSQGRNLATSRIPQSTLGVPLDQMQALVHSAAGDTVRAERLIRRLPPSEDRALLSARIGLIKQPVLSRRTLDAVTPATVRVAAARHMLLAGVLSRSSRRMAQGHLREAAAVAAANDLRMLLVPPPPLVMELAAETALEHRDPNLEWLLGRAADEDVAAPEPPPTTSLSRGELQLLAILPTRAKNVEIAERLGVSVNTVKTRLRRLYAKLGAANRDEAIERAGERGLLVGGEVRVTPGG